MKHKNKYLLFYILLLSLNIKGQNTCISSGNNAIGIGGSVTYSIGQIDYETFSNSNGTLTLGVQQAFEIFNIGIFEKSSFFQTITVYPNPTSDKLVIETNIFNFKDLKYQIIDLNGKIIENNFFNHYQNMIDLSFFLPTVYFVKIIKDEETIKTFKIVKQ
jgi:hypothetical protein